MKYKGYRCALFCLHSSSFIFFFLHKKGVPFLKERGRGRKTVNCPKGPWENRKLWKVQEKARWNLFAGGSPGDMWAIVKQPVHTAISFLLLRRSLVPKGCYLVIALTLWMPARNTCLSLWRAQPEKQGMFLTPKSNSWFSLLLFLQVTALFRSIDVDSYTFRHKRNQFTVLTCFFLPRNIGWGHRIII